MNKTYFIKTLSEKTKLSEKDCLVINSIIEDHFIIGKKNKEKIIEDLVNKLNLDEKKADEVYTTAMDIISSSIKNKIKHPFKSID